MDDLLATVQQWIPVDVLIGLTVASVIGFVGSLIAIPLILVRLPADYFDTRTPRHWMKDHHPVLRLSGLVVKNVGGVVLLLAGFALPRQKEHGKAGQEEHAADGVLGDQPRQAQHWMMVFHPMAGSTRVEIVSRQADQNHRDGNQGTDKADG